MNGNIGNTEKDFTMLAFTCGQMVGILSRDDIQNHLAQKGIDTGEVKNILEALQKFARVFYN